MFKQEKEMAPIVHAFLTRKNLRVRSEVVGYDIMGDNGQDIYIIEMKLSFNLKVVAQACEAQKSGHYVYIAVPDLQLEKYKTFKKRNMLSKKIDEMKLICRRIGVGLLFVSLSNIREMVEPERSLYTRPHNIKYVRDEANGRPLDENIAGTTGVSQMTAYKYRSIEIAKALIEHGPSSSSKLKELTGDKGTYGILYNNHMKWFVNISRGLYDVTDIGREAVR